MTLVLCLPVLLLSSCTCTQVLLILSLDNANLSVVGSYRSIAKHSRRQCVTIPFAPVLGSAWCQGVMQPQMGAAAVQHMDPTAAWYYHYSQSQYAATALNTAALYLTQSSANPAP